MNPTQKFFSKIGFNYLIFGICTIVFQIIITIILSKTNPTLVSDINIITSISSLCNYILPFPILYWLMKKLESNNLEKHDSNTKTFITYIGITLTLMWIGNLIGLLITNLLSGAIQNDIANPVQNLINSTNIWLNLLLISIIAPICEEIIFRKLIIDRTIKYGANVSIVLSAVIFALFHGNLNQFFYALLIGGFFSYIYIKTGKIVYPIILHIIVNTMGSVASLIFAQAVSNLQTAVNPLELAFILIYIIIVFSSFIIGAWGLSRFRPQKLEHSLKTVFLNPGMICFIGFLIIIFIRQILF
jgi:membrane protease YdiL (CAAX protease family)